MTTALRILPLPLPPVNALALVAARFDATLLRANRRYDVRLEIGSQTAPDQPYVVARDRQSGLWSCGCKGWIYWHGRKGPICCKHLKNMTPALTLALELQELAQLPMAGGVWQHPGDADPS